MTTTYSPTRDWHFNTNSHSPSIGYGLGLEYVLNRKLILTGEVIFHRLKYEKVVNIYWDTDDSTTASDERTNMERAESTKGRIWDVPLLLHYGGLARSGILSRMYISGGGAFRTVTSIRTLNTTSYSNGDVESDTTATVPGRRNLAGVVAGAGFRFIDDYKIRVTPEVRYTRWLGTMFGSDTTRSPKNQLEIGLGLYF
jgi:hypothetical protein